MFSTSYRLARSGYTLGSYSIREVIQLEASAAPWLLIE